MGNCLYRAYRSVFFSKEENIVYFEIKARHQRIHERNVLAGAFPVFVAATISRAVVAVIDALIQSEDIEIVLSLIYALVIAQVIGYLVIYFVPTSSVSDILV